MNGINGCSPAHRAPFARRIAIISTAAAIDRRRILQWVLAWAGLSATWMIEDGVEPDSRLEMAKLAASALGCGVRSSD
ncbi:aminoglycoside phosphotransferase family protein [Pseudomonas mosselii]|uniref:aminoglycoside phosphotransferase family protein n=1 Tax=Pseudomonas mosselii TaxID=78327 RepID=UPI001F385E5E|nr:aminoglycoside phosphotransferase family protein [Pseudomonas mosselii]